VTFCLFLMWRVFRVISNVDLPWLFVIFIFDAVVFRSSRRCFGIYICRNFDKNFLNLPFITANSIAQKDVFPKSVRASANAAKLFQLPSRRF
jgi:hypothetical protein